MVVKTAETAGFCFGVKRAVDMVYQQAAEGKRPVFTYGPIIHNEEVVSDLEKRGVAVVEEKERLADCKGGTVIIRSHGVSKEIYDLLEEQGVDYLDATCPFVRKIHKLVEQYSQEGYHIIIIGNGSHPEVEGIRGWGIPGKTTVISTEEEAREFWLSDREEARESQVSGEEKLCIVSQTTFNNNKFKELVEIIS